MKLRMKPYLNVILKDRQTCFVMASEKELFRLSGGSVPVVVERVLPLMDGTRTVEEIGLALSDVLNEKSIKQVIQLLMQNRIIEDVSQQVEIPLEESRYFQGVLTLFSRYSSHPYQLLNQMRKAQVAVLGDTGLVKDMVEALAVCGVGKIDLIVDHEVEPISIEHPYVDIRVLDYKQMQEAVQHADFVIGLQDGEFGFMDYLQDLNRLCLEHKKTWFHLRITLEGEGWLGPFYDPDGACLVCMNTRLSSNLQTWQENRLYEQQVQQGIVPRKHFGFQPFMIQIAQMAAVEVVKYITLIEPTLLYSRTRVIDFLTGDHSVHTVLKVPHCPVCGHAKSVRLYPWDEDEIRVERMLLGGEKL